MFKKIAAGASALVLATVLASCSSGETVEELDEVDVNGLTVEELDEVDVNGLTVSAACEKVRAAGWIVSKVAGDGDSSEMSDCTDSERKVVRAYWTYDSVSLAFAN